MSNHEQISPRLTEIRVDQLQNGARLILRDSDNVSHMVDVRASESGDSQPEAIIHVGHAKNGGTSWRPTGTRYQVSGSCLTYFVVGGEVTILDPDPDRISVDHRAYFMPIPNESNPEATRPHLTELIKYIEYYAPVKLLPADDA